MGPGTAPISLPDDGYYFLGDDAENPRMALAFHGHVHPGIVMVHSAALDRGSKFKQFAIAGCEMVDADYIVTWVRSEALATRNFTVACGFEQTGSIDTGIVQYVQYGRKKRCR